MSPFCRQDAEQAAETLLNLTNLVSAAPPALHTPSLAELSAANVAERGPQASPLQALVQDIMLQQQQRSAAAQVLCCTIYSLLPSRKCHSRCLSRKCHSRCLSLRSQRMDRGEVSAHIMCGWNGISDS